MQVTEICVIMMRLGDMIEDAAGSVMTERCKLVSCDRSLCVCSGGGGGYCTTSR